MSGYTIIGDHGPFRARRAKLDGTYVDGTVTMREKGPQYGAFHPCGDESVVVPIMKWDIYVSWFEPCTDCGEECETCFANLDAGGPAHSGCMGYPYCMCKTSHVGDCK